jgi:hypothetical protein
MWRRRKHVLDSQWMVEFLLEVKICSGDLLVAWVGLGEAQEE